MIWCAILGVTLAAALYALRLRNSRRHRAREREAALLQLRLVEVRRAALMRSIGAKAYDAGANTYTLTDGRVVLAKDVDPLS